MHPVLSLQFTYCILSYLSFSFIASRYLFHSVIPSCLFHSFLYPVLSHLLMYCILSHLSHPFIALSFSLICCILSDLSLSFITSHLVFFIYHIFSYLSSPITASCLISPIQLLYLVLFLLFSYSILSHLLPSVIASWLTSPLELLHPVLFLLLSNRRKIQISERYICFTCLKKNSCIYPHFTSTFSPATICLRNNYFFQSFLLVSTPSKSIGNCSLSKIYRNPKYSQTTTTWKRKHLIHFPNITALIFLVIFHCCPTTWK